MSIFLKTALDFIRSVNQELDISSVCCKLIEVLKKNLVVEPVIMILIEDEKLKLLTVKDHSLVITSEAELQVTDEQWRLNLNLIEQVRQNQQTVVINYTKSDNLLSDVVTEGNYSYFCTPILAQQSLWGIQEFT